MKISIRYKFILGFLIIFLLAGIALHYYMSDKLHNNTKQIILEDMKNMEHYSREYFKQHFMLNNLSKDDFRTAQGELIIQEFSKNHQINVSLYDQKGTFLYEAIAIHESFSIINATESLLLQKSSDTDLKLAIDNKSAFTINTIDQQYIVNFSFPLYIDNDYYGIVRFSKDYSQLFYSNHDILNGFTTFTLLLFSAVFLFSYGISNRITNPILKLTGALDHVSQGRYDTNIDVKTGDELETLAHNFNTMAKKLEYQINTINEEKNKVLRLEKSRQEFFNNVTHELKTPLTTISGYAQIIGDKNFNDSAFLQKAAHKIQDEGNRLHSMVVELIELSKSNSVVHEEIFEKVNIATVLKPICEDMQLKANRYNMKIQHDIETLHVAGINSQLKIVFINLLDNAIKYGVNSTTIYVSARKKDHTAILEVINQSDILNPEVIEKLFEPFYRANNHPIEEKGSNGLGLYICRNIIEQHNGIIEIKNNDNVTRISIKLPLWQ